MAYVVSARKYRPQKFEDVVGQEHVTTTITNALINDKLAHAFLFCGPRGVGKTTCARLLAKVINMEDPKAAIKDGSYADTDIDISLNIVELDAASNNSVEHIRTLTDQVRFPPQQGKYKVFIIDEVHMLSQAAFNAFLKTLEEPPPYAIFILATTERHKILPTILSRCQLYDFRRIQIPDIIKQLEEIATREGIQTEHDALYIIAEKADGAMRDALSIFDRVSSGSDNHITVPKVVENLNILDFDAFFDATNKILTEDASGLLLLFDSVLKRGFEGDIFINGWAGHLRNLLYCKESRTLEMLQVSDQLKEKYLRQAEAISYGTILTGLNLANKCDVEYPKAKDKRLHVEVALLKLCFAERQAFPSQNQSATQKKTPELTPEPKKDQKTALKASIESEERRMPKVTPIEKPQPASKVIAPEPQKEEKQQVPKQEITSPNSPIPTSIPSISSLDAILKQAEAQVASTTNQRKELTQEECEEIWNQYTESIESPTVKGILANVQLEINKENQLQAYVPSNIAKEEIQQETLLYSQLRDHFNQQDLAIEISVDREKFEGLEEEEKLKPASPKEKYAHLKAINPLIDDLIDKLDLKLDQ
ncbi:MAG: DNA polymerase-3 subunit gamma/tau [Saprospiraceae bacterium]|jgi:DNA polymerase-3 subunit gamma/tau